VRRLNDQKRRSCFFLCEVMIALIVSF
jgi:hypothetical protein